MLKLTSGNFEYFPKGSTNKVNIFVIPHTNKYNDKMLGFINVSILSADNKMIKQFNSLSLLESKEGGVFLKEPHQKAFMSNTGEMQSNPWYFMDPEIKEDIANVIFERFEVADLKDPDEVKEINTANKEVEKKPEELN